MAKVTKEMVRKMNSQLANGFQTNIQKLVMGEKMAVKKIALDENNYLLASLWFGVEYENYRKVSDTIELNIARYTKDGVNSEVFVSHGLGYNTTLENGLKRKTWKQLSQHSQQITEAFIVKQYDKYKERMQSGRVI